MAAYRRNGANMMREMYVNPRTRIIVQFEDEQIEVTGKQMLLLADAYSAGKDGDHIWGQGEHRTAAALERRGLVRIVRHRWFGTCRAIITEKGATGFLNYTGQGAGQ